MDIGRLDGVQGPDPIQGKRIQPSAPAEATPTPVPADRIELSQAGRMISETMSMPEVRTDRVAELKRMVENGTYATEARLLGAIENLLREIA